MNNVGHRSFCSQALYRIGQSRFYRLKTDGQQRDKGSGKSCESKDPPAKSDPVGEVLKPVIHEKPGQWGGDQEGNEDQLEEVGGKERDDLT